MKKLNSFWQDQKVQERLILAIIFALIIAVTLFTMNK
jgi:hypothetical protein